MTEDNSSYNEELKDIKDRFKQYSLEDYDLCKWMRSLGIGEAMCVRIIDKFGIKTTRKRIDENPYNLMKVDGIGFIRADTVAMQLGMQSNDPRRQRALIIHVLETNRNFGHVYLPITILEKECKKQNIKSIEPMLKDLIEESEVVIDGNRVYSAKLFLCEVEVGEMIKGRL